MKPEYDFSKAERGKFYHPNAKFNIPIYLDEEVLEYFTKQAETKGIDLTEMINDLLKKDIALIEGIK
jgi:hypothetical protein